MSYEKTVWADGDVITAAKMNHIEDGIETASEGGGGAGWEIATVTITYGESDATIPKAQIDYIVANMPPAIKIEAVEDGETTTYAINSLGSVNYSEGTAFYYVAFGGDGGGGLALNSSSTMVIINIPDENVFVVEYNNETFTLDGDVFRYTYDG